MLVLIPRTYDTPVFKARPGTRFLQLPTGSEIGYFLIPAKGDKKPFPVIFLQGGPGGPIYDRNIELLSSLANIGYDVYLYDQVGCGSSCRLEHIQEYTVERHRRVLEEIIKITGAEKVILIGQSWGAMLATAFIAEHPDRVEKVIFTGPGPILPWNTKLETIQPPDSLSLKQPVFTNRQGRKKIYNLRAKFVEAMAKAFNWKLATDREMDAFSTLLNHEMGKSTLCNPNDPAVIHMIESGSGYYSMVKTVQSFEISADIRSKLQGCPVPALIMRGQCDGIKWGYVSEYLQLFINSKLVIIPDAGHSIGSEQPELYQRNIEKFLTKE
ncbi:MAG: alpha/beta hydrolase [Bacteroidales bacterium]|nr:alpha/beta hydrolase [Bacteroidales bacterium]